MLICCATELRYVLSKLINISINEGEIGLRRLRVAGGSKIARSLGIVRPRDSGRK